MHEGNERLLAVVEFYLQQILTSAVDDRCDLTDLLARQKYAKPFQLVVIKAIIITVERRGKELGTT